MTTIDCPLTPRQLELLAKVSSGLAINKAADEMFIANQTAYNILAAARKNAGAGSSEHLVVMALHNGWLRIDGEGVMRTLPGLDGNP